MVSQGYHDDTGHNHVFGFVVKKNIQMAAKILVVSGEALQKLAEKAVNKNTVKATNTWMNVWK